MSRRKVPFKTNVDQPIDIDKAGRTKRKRSFLSLKRKPIKASVVDPVQERTQRTKWTLKWAVLLPLSVFLLMWLVLLLLDLFKS